ncbi:hypothetical protein FRACA_770026 [Frankia canadensis]|uniref:Pentapeptide repeat-containing protein n=1 Tax=Frankia canadensis TaxID=1836972 RepID=A0A2I2L139_9ACTN|nr:pentapeptide repeat-containing protein [Frankia canadensis]SNQ51643.1 hypothetical protein FRACA_770026 [Frankia canadensis]SOU58933.1 hypothetical protein FRACA_770026 [Frankia canadensis]
MPRSSSPLGTTLAEGLAEQIILDRSASATANANALVLVLVLVLRIDARLSRPASLGHAQLAGQDLSGRDVSHQDLRGADLRGADLTNAGLAHTDLTDADLTGARLTDVDLRATAAFTDTRWTGALLLGGHAPADPLLSVAVRAGQQTPLP